MQKTPWSIKYRPNTLDEYIFENDTHRKRVEQFIKERSIPNLLLRGSPGSGKTSLALLLKNLLNVDEYDFLKLDASDENSVDDIRSKVKGFVSTCPVGDFKLVLLDEADYLSPNAQAALRGVMENPDYLENARFILTCNLPHKIMPAIKSRCQEIEYKSLDKDQILERAAVILATEKVKVKSLDLLESFIDATYPDFRKLLQLLQQSTIDGVLQEPSAVDATLEYKFRIVELMEANKYDAIRSVLAEVSENEWEDLYTFLYEVLHEIGKFTDVTKWKAGIVILADHLYRHSIIADPEINATAMFLRLGDI